MMDKKYKYFWPKRIASWWCTLDDILWPEKKIKDRIKRRAEGFAKAGIDTAINFGFHTRFDYSDYFGSLHGYFESVCDELHKYDIKFMDHYSCNNIERPRNYSEFVKLHSTHRHHILLHPDPEAAVHAQYAGHMFQDLCEMDIRDGTRGYSWSYQTELFCHNNPLFLDMHSKYLKRLISEVPIDGIEVDDMADYAGLATCGCTHCRNRLRRDYGRELPPFGDTSFWGDTSGEFYTWGNYENPSFRDWLRMKEDVISDHLKTIKSVIGDIPLMTCIASTGPIYLNAVGQNLERMTDHLDLLMLENCGFNTDSVNWSRMDAEALQQKDIAEKMGHAPAIALSYTIYNPGGYLGWCLSRFWGVGNWSSTLTGRLEDEPSNAMEIHEIINPVNNWEIKHSNLDYMDGDDVVDVRIVSNRFCRENGWRDDNGLEHWDRVKLWSSSLIEYNMGYRFIRAEELADQKALLSGNTPVILDGVGCISGAQHSAIKEYLKKGGFAWLKLPYGTYDEKGFKREEPLSFELFAEHYQGLIIIDSDSRSEALDKLITSEKIMPRIRLMSGDKRWSARLRVHHGNVVLHMLNRALEAIQHPDIRDENNNPILFDINSSSSSNELEFTVEFEGIGKPWEKASVLSPEIGDEKRPVKVERLSSTCIKLSVSIVGIKLYSVVSM